MRKADAHNDYDNNNANSIFSLYKTQNYMFMQQCYQQKTIKTYKNVLVRDLKDPIIGMNIKQKDRMKI